MAETVQLGTISEMRLGLQASVQDNGTVPMVRVGDLRTLLDWSQVRLTSSSGAMHADVTLRNGDVLIARSGDGSVGNSSLVIDPPTPSTFASYVIRVRPSPRVDGGYLAYWLRSVDGRRQIQDRVVGTPISNLSVERLSTVKVPLPPFEEQQRLGREAHEARQLVQTAKDYVSAARRKVSEVRVASHPIWATLWNGSYEIRPLPAISENRDRARVALNAAARRAEPGATPYYGASGVIDGVAGHTHRGEHVLVSEDGNNLRTRRVPIAFTAEGLFWANNHVHVLEPDSTTVLPRYLAYALDALDVEPLLTGSAQPKLNQRALNQIRVPVPSLTEQKRIIELCSTFELEIERMVSLCEEADLAIDAAWETLIAQSFGSKSDVLEPRTLEDARAEVDLWLERIDGLKLGPAPAASTNEEHSEMDLAPTGYVPVEEVFRSFLARSDGDDLDESVDTFFDWLRAEVGHGRADIRKTDGKSYVRVEALWIDQFKNLRNFDVNFDPGHPISTVVGRNGAGKSNLLEALAIIFRDLDASSQTHFAYRIRFRIRGDVVEVDNSPSRRQSRQVRVNGVRSSLAKLHDDGHGVRKLPDFVFGYYSGPTNRLKRHFDRHQSAFNRSLREGEDLPLRRLFYAKPEHSQFVLLAFFLAEDQSLASKFLKEVLRIEGFDSATFAIGQPDWKSKGGDERFWNARGAVAALLEQLLDLSLASIKLDVPSSSADASRRNREQIYMYLPDLESLGGLSQAYGGSSQQLFAAFESILAADLLADLRVRVRARGLDGSLMFRELSEGEQQLLVVLGLLRFTKESESLFLLDEPDTHLNPAWSIHYTEMLLEHSGNGMDSGQILMASHDPLVIAGLVAEQVVLLRRDDASGHVDARSPEEDPRGMGVAGLLTSDIYGLASDLDPLTFEKVERRRWLASAEWGDLDSAELEELRILTAELEALDFTFTTRDPLYTEFERAMAKRDRTSRQVLLPDQIAARRETAGEVLGQLLDAPDTREAPDAIH